MEIERTYLNMIKIIYYKSTINFILNSEKLSSFFMNTRQDYPFLPLVFNLVLEVLARAI